MFSVPAGRSLHLKHYYQFYLKYWVFVPSACRLAQIILHIFSIIRKNLCHKATADQRSATTDEHHADISRFGTVSIFSKHSATASSDKRRNIVLGNSLTAGYFKELKLLNASNKLQFPGSAGSSMVLSRKLLQKNATRQKSNFGFLVNGTQEPVSIQMLISKLQQSKIKGGDCLDSKPRLDFG